MKLRTIGMALIALSVSLSLIGSAHAYSEEINKAIERGKKIGSDAADIVNGEFNKSLGERDAYSAEITKAIEEGKKIGSDAADIVNGEFNKSLGELPEEYKNMSICQGGPLGAIAK